MIKEIPEVSSVMRKANFIPINIVYEQQIYKDQYKNYFTSSKLDQEPYQESETDLEAVDLSPKTLLAKGKTLSKE